MSGNAQKTWLVKSLNTNTQKRVSEAIQQLGKALPCSVTAVTGSIVTVSFDLTNIPFTLPNVECTLAGPEYIRLPVQAGCKGVVFPADAYIGGVTGLGGGTADLSLVGNLSALVFFPVGNKGWTPTDDPNSLVMYGPSGAIIRDLNKKTSMTLTINGVVFALQAGDAVEVKGNLVVDGNLQIGGTIQSKTGDTYSGDIKTSGNLIAGFGTPDQVGALTHQHTGPGGDTGPPIPGT
jgi:hypothetical protein